MGPFFVSKALCRNDSDILEQYPWAKYVEETDGGFWLSKEVTDAASE